MTAWYVGLTLAYVVTTLLLPNRNPNGQCQGIGWGCTPTPRDSALLVGLFVGVPVVVIGYPVSLGVYALSRSAARTHAVLVGTGAAVAGIVVGVLIAVTFVSATLT